MCTGSWCAATYFVFKSLNWFYDSSNKRTSLELVEHANDSYLCLTVVAYNPLEESFTKKIPPKPKRLRVMAGK